MKEFGKVTEVKGDMAYVLFNRTSMCSKCGACGITASQQNITVSARNDLNARVGDKVELEFTAKNALTSSMIAYIFPLIMLFLGVWIGYTVPQNFFEVQDAMAAILGLVFVGIAFVVLKLLNPVLAKRFGNVYTMVRVEHEG